MNSTVTPLATYAVEFDLAYRGGDYDGVGETVHVKASCDDDVPGAFQTQTGHDRVHIVHFAVVEDEILKTETDTPEMRRRVYLAFLAWKKGRHPHRKGKDVAKSDVFFEHGQLWVRCNCGADWSVHDAEGEGSVDGFGFEPIIEGDGNE